MKIYKFRYPRTLGFDRIHRDYIREMERIALLYYKEPEQVMKRLKKITRMRNKILCIESDLQDRHLFWMFLPYKLHEAISRTRSMLTKLKYKHDRIILQCELA